MAQRRARTNHIRGDGTLSDATDAIDDEDILATWQAQTGFTALVERLLATGRLTDTRFDRLTAASGAASDLLRADLVDAAARQRGLHEADGATALIQRELLAIPLTGSARAIRALADDAAAIGALTAAIRGSGAVDATSSTVLFPEPLPASSAAEATPRALFRLRVAASATLAEGGFAGEAGERFFKSALTLTPQTAAALEQAPADDAVALHVLVGARERVGDLEDPAFDGLEADYLRELVAATRDGDAPPPLDPDREAALGAGRFDDLLARVQADMAKAWHAATAEARAAHPEVAVPAPRPWRALVPALAAMAARRALTGDAFAERLGADGFTLRVADDAAGGVHLALAGVDAASGAAVHLPRAWLGGRRRGLLAALAAGGTMRTVDAAEFG